MGDGGLGGGLAQGNGGATTSGGWNAGGAVGAGGAGGALTQECAVHTECDDGDACTTDRCDGGACAHKLRDDDADGFIAAQCGGDDCNDLNPNAYPSHREICGDGSDNDCDGVKDCFDPECNTVADCACVPDPAGEDCSNGEDDDCDGAVDCNDSACMGTPACGCAASEVGLCGNGIDDDCDGLPDCFDTDCEETAECLCWFGWEQCAGGTDENCNGLIDCAEPTCAAEPMCSCVAPPVAEDCTSLADEDCDGLVDCADPDCRFHERCASCVPEVCDDGVDNDCNNRVDCVDPACAYAPGCAPRAELCNNVIDDDRDGLIDCADVDCANNPICVGQQSNCATAKLIGGSGSYPGHTYHYAAVSSSRGSCGGDAFESVFYFVLSEPARVTLDTQGAEFDSVIYVRAGSCGAGRELGCDDDGADAQASRLQLDLLYPGTYYVFVDGFGYSAMFNHPDAGSFVLHVDLDHDLTESCDDGVDNDGDRLADCVDADCADDDRCLGCNGGEPPAPELGSAACIDGEDNDCDGLIDCADPDCSASEHYATECCNGRDDNGNAVIDELACRCRSNGDCAYGKVCYTHTTFVCNRPCDVSNGDICATIAPGSRCSAVTHQCEF